MGTFCFDQYNHPLLWCDEKKRLIEKRNAEESLRQWRRQKAEEMARKERDKQEYHDMFVKHCPWGRPGGGAPNQDIRRRDITARGLHSIPNIPIKYRHRASSLMPPCRLSDYCPLTKKRGCPLGLSSSGITSGGAGGNGTGDTDVGLTSGACTSSDVKTPADKLCITLKDHQAMTFRNKGHVDIEVHYKASDGKKTLDKIGLNDKIQSTSIENKKSRKKNEAKDPWGKAGPGGKPWRSPKAVGSSFMKSMGWTNKEMLKDLDQDNPATPAENLKSPTKRGKPTKKLDRCCTLCTCTCPATKGSPIKTQIKKLYSRDDEKLKEKHGEIKQNLCPRFTRHCTISQDDGVELVPLLARRRANNRPISLSSTDVTKRTAEPRLANIVDLQHLSELNKQMSQKRYGASMSKQRDREMCNKHFETFETFWGRPGHGAPTKNGNNQKLKLDDLLYGAQSCTE